MNAPNQKAVKKKALLDPSNLPEAWPLGLIEHIRDHVKAARSKVVVLDDDPTGTQTVHGIPVLTHWTVEALSAELQGPHPAFYLLTNSRSMTASRACRLSREIGTRLDEASRQTGISVTVISRSDSTLRGHFPDEVDAMADVMGMRAYPYLIIPCFFEGGRYTLDDIHYVAEGEMMIPAARTAYAGDAAFGYHHSNLRRWVEEKTAGRIHHDQVASVSLKDLRQGGPDWVSGILRDLQPGTACVVNAVSYRDLEVFVLGLLKAEKRGARFLFRTAASFVRVRCGLEERALIQSDDLVADNRNGGLFVVGSYVPKTTEQVTSLLSENNLTAIEIEVGRLLRDREQPQEVARVTQIMNRSVHEGVDALVYTSRELVTAQDAAGSLDIGRRVSDSLIDIVRGLKHQPRYLVAKGGITSSDVATKGLEVRRAMVMGQVLPGVPVWKLGEETRYPGMAYIVFPGNVGDTDALAAIKRRMGVDATATAGNSFAMR